MIGAVERKGPVAAKAVDKKNMKGRNMRAFVRQHVNTEKSSLYTDEYKAYMGMSKVLPHSVSEVSRPFPSPRRVFRDCSSHDLAACPPSLWSPDGP